MDTRNLLLDQALRLFVAKGYESVGVQAVVDAVGVQKPTLYHYFQSKTGLLAALLERDYSPLCEQVAIAAHYTGDLPATLEKIARAYFAFATAHPEIYRFALASIHGPVDSDRTRTFFPYFDRQHRVLAKVFETAVREHGNMRGRHDLHAIAFLGTINAMVSTHFHDARVVLDHQGAFRTCKYFMHGIFS